MFPEILPCIFALFNASQSFIKTECEETLAELFDISISFEKARKFALTSNDTSVKIVLTDAFLKRLLQLKTNADIKDGDKEKELY